MNIKITRLICTIVTAIMCLLSTVCLFFTWYLRIPLIFKAYLTMILLAGIAAIVYFFLKERDETLFCKYGDDIEREKKDCERFKSRAEQLAAENESLSRKINDLQSSNNLKDVDLLRERCETIENFRNSFPYIINKGYSIYNVIRTEVNVSAYSRWLIVGEYNNQLWSCYLLRPDTQTYKEMLSLAVSTTEPSGIEQLNQANTLIFQ